MKRSRTRWIGRISCAIAAATAVLWGCDSGNSPTDGGDGGDNFSIEISLSSSTLSIEQGASGTTTLTLVRGGGYTEAVSLAVQGAPNGVSVTADPSNLPAGTNTSTFTVMVGDAVAPGSYTLTIAATGPDVTAVDATLTVTVTEKPGFTLSASPKLLRSPRDRKARPTSPSPDRGPSPGRWPWLSPVCPAA